MTYNHVLTFSGARRAIELLNVAMPLPHGVKFDLRLDNPLDKPSARGYTLWLRVAGQALPRLYYPHLPLARLHAQWHERVSDMLFFAWRRVLETTHYRETIVSSPDLGRTAAGYAHRWVATLTPTPQGWALEATFLKGCTEEAYISASVMTPAREYGWERLIGLLTPYGAARQYRDIMYQTLPA